MIGRAVRRLGGIGVAVFVVAGGCGSLGPASQSEPTEVVDTTYALPPEPVGTTLDLASMPSTTALLTPAPASALAGPDASRSFPSALPGQAITFRIAAPIPALEGDADVWRLAPGTEVDLGRVAAAFGVGGRVVRSEGGWTVGDGVGQTVSALAFGGAGEPTTWSYYSGALGAPRCLVPGSPGVQPSGLPECVDAAAAAPVATLVERTYDVARAVGFDAVPGAEVVTEDVQTRSVSLFARLGDLWNPVPLSVTWSYDDALVGAQGAFGTMPAIGRAPRIGTAAAVAHLGESGLAKPVEPSPAAPVAAIGGPTVAPGTTMVAFPRYGLGTPTTALAQATTVPAKQLAPGSTTLATLAPVDIGGLQVIEGQISAARPALVVDLTDPSGRLIVPAYVFTTQFGEVITSAVDAAALGPYRAAN